MAFEPTEQQKEALYARGSTLVSAAAGSGKTAVLSNRVVLRVTDETEPVDITDLLIVTFTNAAAEEMRERISSLLGNAVEANPNNHRIMRQKLAVENANIGTIDSFCIDLVRDNFAQAGVNPDFKIISSDSLAVISERQVNEAYIELAHTDYDGYSRLLTALGCESADEKAHKAVTDIYDHIRSLPMPERWLEITEKMYNDFTSFSDSIWYDVIIDYIFSVVDFSLSGLYKSKPLLAYDDKFVKAYEDAHETLVKTLTNITAYCRAKNYDAIQVELANYVKPKIGSVKKCNDNEARLLIKYSIDTARDNIAKLVDLFKSTKSQIETDIRDAAETVTTLIKLVRIYWRNMQREFKDRGVLDFAEVELLSLHLLCDDVDGELRIKESASHLCNRYKEVMVDEYQDTNDLQNAIFNALSGNGERLFLVGDVKQCIYRFRQANPNNFINMREEASKGNSKISKIDLSGNFRSRPEICDFVNFCFSLLMSKKACDIDYLSGDKLDSKGRFTPTTEDCVELHFVESDEIEAQAKHVAKYIKACVERGMPISCETGLRQAKYGDFIVLLRNYSKYSPEFVRAMKKYSVPVRAEMKSQFFDRPEIMMIMSLLIAIDNPLKDISLVSAMMSPVFGFTADEMAELRIANKEGSIYSALLKYSEKSAKAKAFLDKLDKYRSWADSMPVDRLICRIYDDTGMTAVVRAMDDGAARRGNMLVLAEYAADYERSGACGIGAFIRHTDNIKKNDIKLEGASVADSEDTVKIMTIHKSKGLQAPICIVAGLENTFNTADSRSALLMHEKYGIGMRVCDPIRSLRFDTISRIAISQKEHDASIAEEMRLLYVAMTRAQDKLVLVTADEKLNEHLENSAKIVSAGWAVKNEPIDAYPIKSVTKMSDWIYMCSLLHPDSNELRERSKIFLNPATADYNIKINISSDVDDEIEVEQEEYDNEEFDFSPMLDYCYPFEKLLSVESKYSVSELTKSEFSNRAVFKSKPAFITGDTMTPAEKGTATHRFMCYADFANAELSVDNEAALLVKSSKLTTEQANGIDTVAVESFFDDDIYHRLRNADKVMRESRFILELPASEIVPECDSDEPVIIQGVADCVLFEPDGITIIDFKTDRNTTEKDLAERYSKQLKLYARAFASNYKMQVKQCVLYSFFLRKTIYLDI